MSPVTSIVLCAVLFFVVCLCDSFGESELKRDPKIAGIEDTEAGWGEKGNLEDVNQLDEVKTNEYGMERDETKRMEARERRWYRPTCGGQTYNPTLYLCCNGNIQRKPGSWSACCGTVAYNREYYMCCSGRKQVKPGTWSACCGTVAYNRAYYMCCSGRKQLKQGSRSACCGTVAYNSTFYMCCNGKLKRKSGWNPSC